MSCRYHRNNGRNQLSRETHLAGSNTPGWANMSLLWAIAARSRTTVSPGLTEKSLVSSMVWLDMDEEEAEGVADGDLLLEKVDMGQPLG